MHKRLHFVFSHLDVLPISLLDFPSIPKSWLSNAKGNFSRVGNGNKKWRRLAGQPLLRRSRLSGCQKHYLALVNHYLSPVKCKTKCSRCTGSAANVHGPKRVRRPLPAGVAQLRPQKRRLHQANVPERWAVRVKRSGHLRDQHCLSGLLSPIPNNLRPQNGAQPALPREAATNSLHRCPSTRTAAAGTEAEPVQ